MRCNSRFYLDSLAAGQYARPGVLGERERERKSRGMQFYTRHGRASKNQEESWFQKEVYFHQMATSTKHLVTIHAFLPLQMLPCSRPCTESVAKPSYY